MCLSVSPEQTNKFRWEMDKTIKVYKILAVACDKETRSNYELQSIYYYHRFTAGLQEIFNHEENVIENPNELLIDGSPCRVEVGYHCYLYEPTNIKKDITEDFSSLFAYVVVPLTAKRIDLIGVGLRYHQDSFQQDQQEAAFTKLFLDQEDYQKAMEEGRERLCASTPQNAV